MNEPQESGQTVEEFARTVANDVVKSIADEALKSQTSHNQTLNLKTQTPQKYYTDETFMTFKNFLYPKLSPKH